jgi:hypothetical protein
MTPAGSGRPRARSPLLPALLLVLLAAAAVATAQLYWTGLRNGLAQMRGSVALAQQEQQRLMAQLRAAQAALQTRLVAPADASTDAPAAARPSAPRQRSGLRRSLSPPERAQLAERLAVLQRDAARLPIAGRSAAMRGAADPVAAKRLLREQLGVARAAAAAGDPALLDAALFAAERLAAPPYLPQTPRQQALRAALEHLRLALQAAPPQRPPARTPEPAAAPPER